MTPQKMSSHGAFQGTWSVCNNPAEYRIFLQSTNEYLILATCVKFNKGDGSNLNLTMQVALFAVFISFVLHKLTLSVLAEGTQKWLLQKESIHLIFINGLEIL